MAGSCCAKPVTIIIKVADFEAGIIGLEEALLNVLRLGARDEEEVRAQLIASVREFGNYISASRETDYKDALFREYEKFRAALQSKIKSTTASSRA